MRIIISDTSCLIDLRKAALLAVFLRLPFEVLIPNTLFEDELLSFSVEEKRSLVKAGLRIVDLPGNKFRELAMSFAHSLGSAFTMALPSPWRRLILVASCSQETPGYERWQNAAKSRCTVFSGFVIGSSRAGWRRPGNYIPLSRNLRRTPQFGCRNVNWLHISGAIKPTNDREA